MCDHCVLKLRKEVRWRDTQRRDAAAEAKRERKSLKQQWMHARKKRLLHAKHSIEREVLRLNGAEARRRRAATESSRRGRRGRCGDSRCRRRRPRGARRRRAPRARAQLARGVPALALAVAAVVARWRGARHFLSVFFFKLSDSAGFQPGILYYIHGIENSRQTIYGFELLIYFFFHG